MAPSATATEQIIREGEQGAMRRHSRNTWPRLGVRSRQIALITLLVALVVAITTVINIAHLTGVIIRRTEEHARQLSKQIEYAVQQDLARFNTSEQPQDPFTALAGRNSSVRGLMESAIAASIESPITYLYMTNAGGAIPAASDGLDGRTELAANRHMIGDIAEFRPDLTELAGQSAYRQLGSVFLGPPIYEYRFTLTSDGRAAGELRVGVSAAVVRRELTAPITTNLLIGLIAILGAGIVAISSANLLLKPLAEISTSIDRLGLEGESAPPGPQNLHGEQLVTGVTARLKQLGERMAGDRTELEIMRGRLRHVVSHLEERLLLINREGRVILASPDAEDLLGVAGSDINGLPIDECLGANHPLISLVERAFSERRSIDRTTLEVAGDVGTRQLLASVQYIEDAGEPVGALVSLRDSESYQKLESQWDLSKKLADLGRITSGIAHEVKNPLNAMVIHLEILRSKLETRSGDPSPHLQILDTEIKRLDRVVQTFLNFTRPIEVKLSPINLNNIVNEVVALASSAALERGITISQERTAGALMVRGDSDMLKQALLNIIINGCQAMPEGGPLKVTTARAADGSAHVIIQDRGAGIPQDARDRIFNLYYTTKKGGTGIGLAQAFRATQLHNGNIRFESEVGVGTTFIISLPG